MSIDLVSLKCPDCGAQLNIEQGRKEAFCSYCGAKIVVNNENEHIYRYIDEAALKRAETEHMVRMNEERRRALEDERKRAQEEDQRRAEQRVFAEQEEKRKKKRRICIIAASVIIILGFLSRSAESLYLLFGLFLLIWGFVSTKSPDTYTDRNEQTGVKKVKVPSSMVTEPLILPASYMVMMPAPRFTTGDALLAMVLP